jgi:methyl-accepting chemotaxis protein
MFLKGTAQTPAWARRDYLRNFRTSFANVRVPGTAQGLSQGANEQTASIKKLSVSVEELASALKQNASRISIIEEIARQGSC